MSNAAPTPTADPLRFLNLRDFARAAGVSERALYDLRRQGLPCMRVGTKLLFNPAVALPWMERRYDATAKPTGGDR